MRGETVRLATAVAGAGVVLCVLASGLGIGQAAAASPTPAQAAPAPQQGLKIVVLEGEDGVNVIDKKTAVAPVIEVRDRNDLPVSGASVVFSIGGRGGAAFANGARQITVLTDSVGHATATGLTPVAKGAVQINVRAAFQQQIATATIHQTNFATAAAAAPASSSGGAAGGGTGSGAGAGGAGGAGGAAGGAGSAAAGAGAGLSGAAIGGIVAGAAAAAVVTAKAVSGGGDSSTNGTQSSSPSSPTTPPTVGPPVVSGVAASPTVGLQSGTAFTFTAQGASDPSGALPTFAFDFGDGSSGSGNPATHTYGSAGTFQVRVTVSGRGGSASASTSITVKSLTGSWRGTLSDGGSFPRTFNIVVNLNQNGTSLSGSYSDDVGDSGSVSGSLSGSNVNVSLALLGCVIPAAGQVNAATMVMTGTYPPASSCGVSGGTFSITKQ
jgi:hypothetical protein